MPREPRAEAPDLGAPDQEHPLLGPQPFLKLQRAGQHLISVDIVDNVTRIFPTFLLFWCCGLRHWACLSDDNALTFESRANALGALDFNMIMQPQLRTVDL